MYDLFGVVNHYGGLFGGHYTACTNVAVTLGESPGVWRAFDDDDVSVVPEGAVVSKNAYILCYVRRGAGGGGAR